LIAEDTSDVPTRAQPVHFDFSFEGIECVEYQKRKCRFIKARFCNDTDYAKNEKFSKIIIR
uniref:DUF3872 domain-containing protein n=1 Tax=Haemonchus placei TaxID=6290 RepID=A0A0N4X076_HAEPC